MSWTALFSALTVVLLLAAPMAVSQLGTIRGLLALIHIQGTLYCTANGNMGVQGSATPTFPNAVVQMQCGSGTVVSSAETGVTGTFSILLDPSQLLLSFILNNCSLVVTTPLSDCNTGLPSFGSLGSPLLIIGNTLIGLFNITNIIPMGFQFVPLP